MKRALITGITGQDGSYLTEFLISKGYEVHGIVRRSSIWNRARIDFLDGDFLKKNVDYGDLTDASSLEKIMRKVEPDEIYNLGAQSHVRVSFDVPENTADIDALGTLRMLEAMKNLCPKARFYQASSSEMFGKVLEIPQSEKTPFNPVSPYGCSKLYAFSITKTYREAYGLHASNGILFNHESQRRGEAFVTRKITRALSRIKLGLQHTLSLGNLDAERDWGHAQDYVEAMWMMMQQDEPDDYVIGTGEKHSVREFLETAAGQTGLKIRSDGKKGLEERYLDENGDVVVSINPIYFRPAEVDLLCADASKARAKLGWEPQIRFKELVKLMVENDLKIAEKEVYLKNMPNNS